MADYIVTIRTKDGSLAERDYTANDRAELFQKLAADGVTAVKISEGVASKKPRKAAKKVANGGAPAKGRGLLAAAIVVLGAGLAVWWMMKGEEKGEVEVAETVQDVIVEKEKKPRDAEAEKLIEYEAETNIDKDARPTRVGQKLNGYVMLASGRLHKVRGETIVDLAAEAKPKWAIFKRASENIIASLLMLEPGQGMVGTPRYNGAMEDDFIRSLKEPIVITDEDSEEVRELKKLVKEAKENLKKELKAGRNIEGIIEESRKECQQLAKYKHLLKANVLEELRKENVSESYVDELVAAANLLLEEKGIAPLELGPISRVKIKMK